MYMLDTTDYTMDWNGCYKNWYGSDNYYLRDRFYSFFCSKIDFAGKYVNPRFLMNYMRGDYDSVKKYSKLETFKRLNVALLVFLDCSLLKVIFSPFSLWIRMAEEVSFTHLAHYLPHM